jgi:hypothetical protein
VEGTEHGEVLTRLLPGWRLVHARPDADGRQRNADKGEGPVTGTRLVVTAVVAASRGLGADVLVRADGGEWSLRVEGFPPALDGGENRDVLLVDFADDFDRQAAHDTGRRRRDYQARGWEVRPAPADP